MNFDLIILSLIQGFSEFFPISSSGQMFLFDFFFNSNLTKEEKNFIFIFLHFGTMLSCIVFFYSDLKPFLSFKFIKALIKKLSANIQDFFYKKISKKKKSQNYIKYIIPSSLLTLLLSVSILFLFYGYTFFRLSFFSIPNLIWIIILWNFILLSIIYKKSIKKKPKWEKPRFFITKKNLGKKKKLKFIYLLLIAFLPSLLIAGSLKLNYSILDIHIENLSIHFFITGLILTLSSFFYKKNKNKKTQWFEISLKDAFFIGIIQGLSALPGLSRSGLTISAGILLNFDIIIASRFSFLLSIPTIFSAILSEILQNFKFFQNLSFQFFTNSIFALFISFLTGYFALKFLFFWVKKFTSLYPFAFICFVSSAIIYFML